jgi:hypothetical protein
MTRHRSISTPIFLTLSLTLIAVFAIAPGSASAGSLLSGYGGPGSGAQALLGSTLVNAPPPGGGSSGGGSSTSGTNPAGGASATTIGSGSGGGGTGGSAGPGGGAHGTGSAGVRGGHVGSGQGATGASKSSAAGSSTYLSSGSSLSAAGMAAAEDAGPLGLTGADVLLFALVLGLLAVTAGITTRLARTQH